MDNNQLFRNCFVIIYCHLTKVSPQINKWLIFEPNELSITLSTLWLYNLLPKYLKDIAKVVEYPNRPLSSLGCFETTPSISM